MDPAAVADLGSIAGVDSGAAKVFLTIIDLTADAPVWDWERLNRAEKAARICRIIMAQAGAQPEAENDEASTTQPLHTGT